jgi:pyrimidine operon attenuation protein/uracil phosphoribosyltransferase
MNGDLATTNVLLAILATISVLEALVVVGLFAGGFVMFRRLTKVIADIEERRIAPGAAKVNAILDDVKSVTERLRWFSQVADRFRGAGGLR